jgi:hypothetical protein
MFHQFSYGALWDFAKDIQPGTLSVQAAGEKCKALAASKAKELRAAGWTVRQWTLRGQTREYWSLGNPCGLACTCYMINANRAEV